MQIKINDKMLSITPYLSTPWSQVASMHMKDNLLAITLQDGNIIQIPDLSEEQISLIFNSHAHYLEKELSEQKIENSLSQLFQRETGEPMVKFAFGALDDMSGTMQHNPAQANAPEVPREILDKIVSITKIISPEADLGFENAQPSCNCFYCQIARALHPVTIDATPASKEETVLDSELEFSQWAISQVEEQLFTVTNKLDSNEKYSVFLGEPVGCTCGKKGCEHVLAVLKS